MLKKYYNLDRTILKNIRYSLNLASRFLAIIAGWEPTNPGIDNLT